MGQKLKALGLVAVVLTPLAAMGAVLWQVGIFDGGLDPNGEPAVEAFEARGDRSTTSTTAEEIARYPYEPGDCVTWDINENPRQPIVVACAEPHRIQITEEVAPPSGLDFPSDEEWRNHLVTVCTDAAERFLGQPLDPAGRLDPHVLHPTPEGWAEGDRTTWCAITSALGVDVSAEPLAEDARTTDQAHRFATGACIAYPPVVDLLAVVPCTEPHHVEVVGQIDLSDREGPPPDDDPELHEQCASQVRAYLGTDPVPPWQPGKEPMAPESWAAGTRIIHCFVGQWDANDQLIVVTTSARG